MMNLSETFVLIPGAWMGAWVWEPVTRGLRSLGHEVHPLTLSGMTGDTDATEVTLETHVGDVLSFLETQDLRDVILVGHSYSGLVVGQVTDRVPERIKHTVYVDAFLPRDGKSLLDAFPAPQRQDELRQIAEHGGYWTAPDVEGAADGHGLSLEQAQWLVARLVDQPGRTVSEPAVLKHPLAQQRATYIQCSFEVSGDLAALQQEPGWTFQTLRTGHWPMISAPTELVALLAEVGGTEESADLS
jgi:pimeloyl-ACP methyl ester carboxylesterase